MDHFLFVKNTKKLEKSGELIVLRQKGKHNYYLITTGFDEEQINQSLELLKTMAKSSDHTITSRDGYSKSEVVIKRSPGSDLGITSSSDPQITRSVIRTINNPKDSSTDKNQSVDSASTSDDVSPGADLKSEQPVQELDQKPQLDPPTLSDSHQRNTTADPVDEVTGQNSEDENTTAPAVVEEPFTEKWGFKLGQIAYWWFDEGNKFVPGKVTNFTAQYVFLESKDKQGNIQRKKRKPGNVYHEPRDWDTFDDLDDMGKVIARWTRGKKLGSGISGEVMRYVNTVRTYAVESPPPEFKVNFSLEVG